MRVNYPLCSVVSVLVIMGMAACATPPEAEDVLFPSAEPEEVGMCPDKLANALATAHEWVAQEEIIGGVLLVVRQGKKVLHEAFGLADRANQVPMSTDIIFLTASMTKPMTGTAVLQLYEQGLIDLQDRVSKHVPEFDTQDTREITVYQLLTHTGGLPAWTSGLESGSHQRLVRSIAEDGLRTEPGTEFHYSDRGSTVLGYLVERVSGKSLMDYLKEHILDPLEMNDSYFTVSADDPRLERVPPRYRGSTGSMRRWQTSQGIDRSFLGGSGGLYSTTLDYARFMKAFQQGGRLGDVRLLSEETVKLATNKHQDRPGGMYDYGLHWGIGLEGLPYDAISHGGSRGTIAYLDRENDLMVLYFTQTRRTPTRVPMVHLVHGAIEN